ncbi:MAG: amidohydrolase family protein [Actinomycetia bacterium]|nr:amidohydrolase family protein [Actinomycetes bacterium]
MSTDKLDLLLTDAVVVTLDPERRILDRGHIGVRNGRIALLAGGSAPSKPIEVTRTLDARGGLVHPGLIDAHAHVAWGLARCFIPEHFSEDEVFWNFDVLMLNGVSDADENLGTRLSCAEMAMNGTTCFADTGSAIRDLAPTAEGVEAVGIRGMIANLVGDSGGEEIPALDRDPEQCLARLEDGLHRYPAGDGNVWACAGLCGMELCSDALVRDAKALADRHGVPLNLHKSFSSAEVDERRTALGGREPLEGFAELGVLAPNTMLVHLNHCSPAEEELVAATDSAVVHCPTATLMYAAGGILRGRFPELLARGATVALGTDATQWQNAWDLSRSIYLAATVHKETSGVRTAITAEAALEMATLHGARALGREDELGSLEVGKLADIVVHSTARPEAHPPLDPIGTLVFSGQSRTVRTVLVGGRVVVEEGLPTRIDLGSLLAEVNREAKALCRRIGFTPSSRWPVIVAGAGEKPGG